MSGFLRRLPSPCLCISFALSSSSFLFPSSPPSEVLCTAKIRLVTSLEGSFNTSFRKGVFDDPSFQMLHEYAETKRNALLADKFCSCLSLYAADHILKYLRFLLPSFHRPQVINSFEYHDTLLNLIQEHITKNLVVVRWPVNASLSPLAKRSNIQRHLRFLTAGRSIRSFMSKEWGFCKAPSSRLLFSLILVIKLGMRNSPSASNVRIWKECRCHLRGTTQKGR